MAANHNSQGPEGNYDPAGSTQMFRAFVEEAAPAGPGSGQGPAVPGARRRQAAQGSGSKAGLWLGVGVVALVLIGVVAWLAL
ncbi:MULTISPECIES: hypothetical protein [Streptomyces]|uniref:hypothetical protein n=1 Tax=Streptomyces TaxID=1883 RepID=UPI0004C08214|nr:MULTISPECIES: hypothetical protein [Streptomyces]KOY55905.1 membrane protein [Streptomyces sp. XY332]TDU77297.1 hypothetical protein EDD91_4033 [Streptomyces sp. KS 21]